MKQATIEDLINDLALEGNLVPYQLHDGLRLLNGLCVQGKFGRDDKDIAQFLTQYKEERFKNET